MPWHIVEEHSECPSSKPWALVKDSDGSVVGCHESKDKAEDQMAALHASENRERRPPLEYRNASVSDVNFSQRLISLIAVPYEQEATIEYRGELWQESFMRGAFNGLENSTERVGVNRDHDKSKTVGKAIQFWPSREEGLVADIRIAKTKDGDDTLALANEDMISPSVGFGVRGSDQILDRPYRKIKRAFLDHISFVETPAYVGAKVLAVREGEEVLAADLPRLVTPRLDEVQAWLRSRQFS